MGNISEGFVIYAEGTTLDGGAAHYVRKLQQPMLEHSPVRDGSNGWSTFEEEALPHSHRLFRLAMWLERNRADAEDAVQETMVQAMRSFHRFQPGTNCRAWLITILQRIISNRRRARDARYS